MWAVLLRGARPAGEQISGGRMTWAAALPGAETGRRPWPRLSGRCWKREHWKGRIRQAQQQIMQIEVKLTAE